MSHLFVTGIGELVTNDPDRPGTLGVIRDAAIVVENGAVAWVGPAAEAPDVPDFATIDADGRAVVPGFVDAHTHVVFAGERADEFDAKLRGAAYEDILRDGGGILSTVRATRAASGDDLLASAMQRVRRMLAAGTTTLEIKSGYGLELATEVKMLRVAKRIGEELPVDVVTTFLGAHVVPEGFRDDRSAYVDCVCGEMMGAVAGLAEFCDVFCDEAAFSVDEARRIASAARAHGFGLRFHADQLSHTGGTALAAELGAASADHLDHAGDSDLGALAAAGTVAVLLPAVSFAMRTPYPNGRRVWDAGVTVALGTDCNPGTAYVETMPFVIALATQACGLLPEEALWAATRGAALGLDRADLGWIVPGAQADLVILDAPSHVHLSYRPDGDLVARVVKRGEVVV